MVKTIYTRGCNGYYSANRINFNRLMMMMKNICEIEKQKEQREKKTKIYVYMNMQAKLTYLHCRHISRMTFKHTNKMVRCTLQV